MQQFAISQYPLPTLNTMRVIQAEFEFANDQLTDIRLKRSGALIDADSPEDAEIFEDLFLIANFCIRVLSNGGHGDRSTSFAMRLCRLSQHIDCSGAFQTNHAATTVSKGVKRKLLTARIHYNESQFQLKFVRKGFSYFGQDLPDAEENSAVGFAQHLAKSHQGDIAYLRRLSITLSQVVRKYEQGVITLLNHAQIAASIAGPAHVIDVGVPVEDKQSSEFPTPKADAPANKLHQAANEPEVIAGTEDTPTPTNEAPCVIRPVGWPSSLVVTAVVTGIIAAVAMFWSEGVKLFSPGNHTTTSTRSLWRTWTSVNGAFSVEARYLRLEDRIVFLQRRDGKTLRVPIEKLSTPDIRFVFHQSPIAE